MDTSDSLQGLAIPLGHSAHLFRRGHPNKTWCGRVGLLIVRATWLPEEMSHGLSSWNFWSASNKRKLRDILVEGRHLCASCLWCLESRARTNAKKRRTSKIFHLQPPGAHTKSMRASCGRTVLLSRFLDRAPPGARVCVRCEAIQGTSRHRS